MSVFDVLGEVQDIIAERATTHGDAMAIHEKIARLWSAYLGAEMRATDVAVMMVLLKVARDASRDSYLDMVGYSAIAAALAKEETL